MAADERYCFLVEWYEPNAALIHKYHFFFYPKDSTAEMFDVKKSRMFLRRCKCEGLRLGDMFIGSTQNILSRQLKFVDYGDDYTRKQLNFTKERTLAMIKPDGVPKMGHIIDMIGQNGLQIKRLRMCRFTRNEAHDFYVEHKNKPFYGDLIDFITNGRLVVMELMGSDCINKWRELLGPTDVNAARSNAPMSLRARFGTNATMNAAHGSDSAESAAIELEFFFPSTGTSTGGRPNTAMFSDCTCCVIKPHAVIAGLSGVIIQAIQHAGFEISALGMFYVEKPNALEFYEVYKGVVQEHPAMVDQLTSGPCMAMEIRAQDSVLAFRDMVGPADPEIARHLRPRTLRAVYGKDKVMNAVHCTDLPDDGLLEVEYFFRILDS